MGMSGDQDVPTKNSACQTSTSSPSELPVPQDDEGSPVLRRYPSRRTKKKLTKTQILTITLILSLVTCFIIILLISSLDMLRTLDNMTKDEPLSSGQIIQIKVSKRSLKLNPVEEATYRDNLFYHLRVQPIEEDDSALPTLLNSPVLVSAEENEFKQQDDKGIQITDKFVIFMFRVSDHQKLSYELEFTDKNQNFVGEAVFVLKENINRTNGVISCQIMGMRASLGTLEINYLLIMPFKHSTGPAGTGINQLSGNGAKVWKEKHRKSIIHCGHRGLGVGMRNDLTSEPVYENTIASFNYAAAHGADMVELDVSLTKDRQVIVYHDLELLNDEEAVIYPINNLTMRNLDSLNFQPVERDLLADEKRRLRFLNASVGDFAPFPKLRDVFKRVNPKAAINVEIKHPYETENGTWIPPMVPHDINLYIDTILEEVINFAGNRDIFFSSFDPDVCSAVRLKQTRYPISLITRINPYIPKNKDVRMTDPKMSKAFVESMDLTGLNFISDYLMENPNVIKELHATNHVVYAWQSKMTVEQIKQLIQMGVDGLIYDGIDEKMKMMAKQPLPTVATPDKTIKGPKHSNKELL